MKIAVVAPTFIPAQRANTIQVMKMTQAIAAIGHDTRLAIPLTENHAPHLPTWDWLARHYGLRQQFIVTWLDSELHLRGYYFAMRALIWAREWGAELIFTRHPQTAAVASLWGVPSVLEVHDVPQGRFGPLVFRLFLMGSGSRRLVVITQALKEALLRRFAVSDQPFMVTAPDGVDLERYESLTEPYSARRALAKAKSPAPVQLPANRFTAGYTGHIYEGRGVRLILEMAACLDEITFLLAGGEKEAVVDLRKEVQERNLENVYVTGFVPNAELPLYQAACDVLLMPYQRQVSASSGGDIAQYLSPMKLFEYMASGRMILSSDLPVLREVLSSENAVLLPPDDAEAWIHTLREMQHDPAKYAPLAEQARQDVAKFTWEGRAKKVLNGLRS